MPAAKADPTERDVVKWTWGRSAVVPWLVLAVGLAASLLLFRFIENSVQHVASLRFEREANTANGIVEDRLRSYSDVLYGLRALFASDYPLDRLKFHRFIEALDLKRRYPGFDSLNYAAYVNARDKSAFEQAVRRDTSLSPEGYPGFAIKPKGERPEYYVMVYLEPMAGYGFAFGLDIAANPAAQHPERLLVALRAARDSGELTASGQPLRVKNSVFLGMRLAVYRPGMPLTTVEQRRVAYVGSVGAGLNLQNLMRQALSQDALGNMRLRLFDVGSGVEMRNSADRDLLFDSAPPGGKASETPTARNGQPFVSIVPIEIAGRVWEFEYSAHRGAVMSATDRYLPAAVLAGGLLLSILLFGVLHAMASSRIRAVALAQEITKDLRESEAGLAEAQRMAHLGNWALDPQTMRVTGSEETWRILGLDSEPADFGFADFLRRVHETDRAAAEAALRRSIDTGTDCEIEHRVQTGTGAVRWMHTVLHPGRRDNRERLPGTIMDVTPRKLAEDELKASAQLLQALSRRLVDAQEFERRRFSRELHDLVGQNLTALSINLDILKSQIGEKTGEPVAMRLDDSAALLESTTAAIENVMSELRPPMLDDYGLLPALQWYGGEFTRRTGIEVRMQGDERMRRLPAGSEIALFRIVQEALNNVSKHARARVVDIKLEERNAHCVVSVCDDGVGFDDGAGSATRRRPGLGMVTMRERTQAIGGSFHIEATSGCGTRITVTVPA